MKVHLLIVATNKYIQFLPGLLESAEQYFCKDAEVNYLVFTDRMLEAHDLIGNITNRIYKVDHKPWPYATLNRCHFFNKWWSDINDGDYYFYIDVDTLFTAPINAEDIISERVGTQHCGFVGKRGSYETNPASMAYVGPEEGEHYFGGGFWGFSKKKFRHWIQRAVKMIDTDELNGIIPVWHDESVLNRYFIDWPPTKVLTPSYHYPQSRIEHYRAKWPESYPCKILLLNKNHAEFRQ